MHCILALQLLLIVFFTPHIGQWSRANPNSCLHLGMQIFHRFSVRGRDLFLSNEIKASSGLNEQLEAQRNRVNSGLNEVEESQRIWINSGLNEEEYSGRKDLYRFLHSQDRRRLVGNNKTPNTVLQFSSGNETMDYGDLFGWLHYTVIDVGTPNTSFLVALDTGSDQLWIPCQCKQCASTSNVSHLLNMPLQPYDPSTSNTSKQITCGSSLCYSLIPCANESDDCGYTAKYLSDNTSSSGVLFEDVIHLASATTGKHGGSIEFPFVFGCAQNQSGAFLNGGAPNGLLGLGFGEISLPSSLARSGLITNSFSMCFQDDGSGRIFFGDTGTPSQQTTPLLPLNTTHLPYVVGLDKIYVGNNIFSQSSVKIIVDTGTSFTYFPPKVYATLTAEFDGQVQLERAVFTDVPWEYCYKLSLNDDPVLPAISMVFQGGGNFSVVSPLVGIPNVNRISWRDINWCLIERIWSWDGPRQIVINWRKMRSSCHHLLLVFINLLPMHLLHLCLLVCTRYHRWLHPHISIVFPFTT